MDTILEAIQLVENNQIEKALKLLKDFSKAANDDEKYTIAELYLKWGFLEEAAGILHDLMEKYPDESDLKLSLVDIYIEIEDDESAIALLDNIKEEDPEYVQALLQQADLYQAQGLFEVAEQKLLTAKNILPNEVIIDFALGELFFSIGEYLKAVTYYEKVAKEETLLAEVSILDRLAESYAAIGEYEKAIPYFKDGSEESPDKFYKYGVTASQAGRNDIAIKAWKRVIERDEYYHSVYYNLAKALQEEGLLEESYQTAKRGLQIDSFNKQLFLRAGMIAHQLNQEEESEDFVRQAIALDPEYREAILFLLEFLKERNRYTEIIELLTEIKATGSLEALFDWELARAYNEEEQYADALNAYKEAYINLNDDTDFLKEYGYFLTEEGLTPEAITVFEKYLQQIPDDYVIEEYVLRLKHPEEY